MRTCPFSGRRLWCSGGGLRRNLVKGSIAALLLSLLAHEPALAQDSAHFWLDVMENHGADSTFRASVERGRTTPWPRIPSVKLKNTVDDYVTLQRLAKSTLVRLEDMSSRRLGGDGELRANAESLITLRNKIRTASSYVNFILSDSVDRVVFVEIAEELGGRRCGDVDDLRSTVAALGAEDLAMSDLAAMVAEEVGQPAAPQGAPKDVFERLWQMTTRGSPADMPAGLDKVPAFKLIEAHLPHLVLWRMAISDYFTRGAVPRALAYVAACTGMPEESPEIIGSVLKEPGAENPLWEAMGFWPEPAGILLHEVRTGHIRGQLMFR
jgi:hypothetical protein